MWRTCCFVSPVPPPSIAAMLFARRRIFKGDPAAATVADDDGDGEDEATWLSIDKMDSLAKIIAPVFAEFAAATSALCTKSSTRSSRAAFRSS